MPGFFDNRGIEEGVVTATFTKNILEGAASVKFFIICEIGAITAKRGALYTDELVPAIDSILGKHPNTLIINKVIPEDMQFAEEIRIENNILIVLSCKLSSQCLLCALLMHWDFI